MSVWAQVDPVSPEDGTLPQRVTTIPPDKKTAVSIYASFSFGTASVPDGTVVKFIAGKGTPPETETDLPALLNSIAPMTGVELYETEGIVETRLIQQADGKLGYAQAAKVTLHPIGDILQDNVTVAAYSTYDRIGTANRFAFGYVTLTVSGGQGVFLTAIDRYDVAGNLWETKADMPTGRSGPFCATVTNKVYAIGGFNGNFVNNCEEYDPVTDVWSIKTPMNVARGFGCTAVVASKIYVMGGYSFDPGRTTNAVEVYDPSNDAWATLANMPVPLAFGACQVVGTDIWVFYGASKFTEQDKLSAKNSAVLIYDTVGNTWTASDAVVAGAVSTTLYANVVAGDTAITVPSSAALPNFGAITIDRGGTAETVLYSSFQNDNTSPSSNLFLVTPLLYPHSAGDSVINAALPQERLGPNICYDGATTIRVFNGFDQDKTEINGLVETFDASSLNSVLTASAAPLPRHKAGQALVGTSLFVVEGSADKSDFVGQIETVDVTTGVFTPSTSYAKATIFRTSFGCAEATIGASSYVFALGGQGSGHLPGWLKMEVTTTPEEINADGKETSSVSVKATDASGDSPPDNTIFRVRGLVYISKAQKAAAQAEVAATTNNTGATTSETRVPLPTISVLPVLFSSQTVPLISGEASTILLPRSEDSVNEVQNLLNFVKGTETVLNQQALKDAPASFANAKQKIGEVRNLYSVAIEVTAEDAFYYGQTDSEATAADIPDVPLASGTFSFNPPVSRQGQSGHVGFTSDITSIPDVQFVIGTTDSVTVSSLLDTMQQEIPFGASPHYDAIVAGANRRITNPPSTDTNMMVTTSDNEESGSSYSPLEVAEEVNLVNGPQKFPVFITTVVVTDPISLAARKARTDVSDLELISSETGGHSFSLDRPEYISFIIDRIKTSAPASIGAGTITMTHEMSGPVMSIEFTVDNMIVGNSAQLTARYSLNGYNFIDTGILLEATNTDYGYGMPVTTTYVFGVPLNATMFEYTVLLSSKTFSSPILQSVVIKYIKPNIQYLFTYPQAVNGQVSEMAIVDNERLPSGGAVTAGFIHGDSKDFDNEFVTSAQPAVSGRGTVTAIQRTGPLVNGVIFRDELTTLDGLIFTSKSGPWAQDSVTQVFIQNIEVLPTEFIPVPEEGLVVFRKRLPVTTVPTIEVQNKSTFVVGLKAYNPTLQPGVLDSFAFMYGETEAVKGLKSNRPPAATNLFITPEPIFPGGPIVANYTFTDPDGNEEDKEQTQITWYRNGVPVQGLANKRSISDSDILASRADASSDNLISRGQQWFFSVRPSDGRSFGPLAISHSITVANIPPSASNARLSSSNTDDPLKFTSSDTITAQFDFSDNDQGDTNSGTTYVFSVNGIEVKSGTANSIAPTEEDSKGNKLFAAGSTVFATITPFDGRDFGNPITTSTVTVLASPPAVNNVAILPTAPSVLSSLVLSYQFVSLDGEQDQSRIAWYRNGSQITTFDNTKTVPRGNLKAGQTWYAVVTPFGGSTEGTAVKSNTVVVQD